MSRLALGGALALALMPAIVSAQDADCAARYRSFLEKVSPERQKRMSGDQLAALNRRAQRVYDACVTGHLSDPKALFESLDRYRN
jgi:hypothetical protein